MPKSQAKKPRAGVIAPTKERRRHGVVVRLDAAIKDSEDRIGRPWLALDTLARMLRAGAIGKEERAAGERFHDDFRSAGFDRALGAVDPGRPRVQVGGSEEAVRRSEAAYLRVMGALDGLGGIATPSGDCAWHVLGCEMSLDEWARAPTWRRRALHHNTAAGILLADLALLRLYYGL